MFLKIKFTKCTEENLREILNHYWIDEDSKSSQSDLKENIIQLSDPVDSYFECISYCDISDGTCISKCIEILRESDN